MQVEYAICVQSGDCIRTVALKRHHFKYFYWIHDYLEAIDEESSEATDKEFLENGMQGVCLTQQNSVFLNRLGRSERTSRYQILNLK